MNSCIDEALVIKFLDYSQNIYIDFCYVLIMSVISPKKKYILFILGRRPYVSVGDATLY